MSNAETTPIYTRYTIYVDSARVATSRRWYDETDATSDEIMELISTARQMAKDRANNVVWRAVNWSVYRDRVSDRGRIYAHARVTDGTEEDK